MQAPTLINSMFKLMWVFCSRTLSTICNLVPLKIEGKRSSGKKKGLRKQEDNDQSIERLATVSQYKATKTIKTTITLAMTVLPLPPEVGPFDLDSNRPIYNQAIISGRDCTTSCKHDQ